MATKPAPDLSVKELAEQIGVHPVRASDLIRRGYFPGAFKTGAGGQTSPWRIPATAVTEYKARQPQAPARAA